MRRKFLLFILPSLFLNGCVNKEGQQNLSSNTQEKTETIGLISYDYEELEEKLIQWDDIEGIDLNHFYVYFFSRTCNHCQRIKNLVIPNLLKRKIFFACEASGEHVLCGDQRYGPLSQINFCILGYPTIVEFKNWAVVKYANGENEVLSLLNTK